jgi:hypothetical protein
MKSPAKPVDAAGGARSKRDIQPTLSDAQHQTQAKLPAQWGCAMSGHEVAFPFGRPEWR